MSIINLIAQCAKKLSVVREGKISKLPFFSIHPTAANFFLIRLVGIELEQLKAHLAAHKIQVRSRPDMPDHIRVTSMLPHENQHLLNVLNEFER